MQCKFLSAKWKGSTAQVRWPRTGHPKGQKLPSTLEEVLKDSARLSEAGVEDKPQNNGPLQSMGT